MYIKIKKERERGPGTQASCRRRWGRCRRPRVARPPPSPSGASASPRTARAPPPPVHPHTVRSSFLTPLIFSRSRHTPRGRRHGQEPQVAVFRRAPPPPLCLSTAVCTRGGAGPWNLSSPPLPAPPLPGVGCRVEGSWFMEYRLRFIDQGLGFGVWGLGFRVSGFGSRVSNCRVPGSRFWVWDSEFRATGSSLSARCSTPDLTLIRILAMRSYFCLFRSHFEFASERWDSNSSTMRRDPSEPVPEYLISST